MLDQTVASQPAWLTDVLWPGSQATATWWGRASTRFIAVPSNSSPTQLLPWSLGSCRAAANRRSDDRTSARSLGDGVGVFGLLALAPVRATSRLSLQTAQADGTGNLVDHLRSRLDDSIRRAVVLCGPPRANQKPVLQLIDRWGRTIAFAKVAWNPLTRELLDAERGALQHLAGIQQRGFVVPRVLASGEFSGGSWLAMSPATVQHRQQPSRQATFDLARAVERTGPSWTGVTADSSFAEHLRASAAGLPRSEAIVARLLAQHGDSDLTLRPAHGDFVPWNILSGRPSFALWDWERYDLLRPVGFDRLHFAFQVEVARRARSTAAAAAEVVSSLGDILPDLEKSVSKLHFEWYLADVMCRYERDGGRTGVAATTTRGAEIADMFDTPGSL